MKKKYEFTNEVIVIDGHVLYRIRALKDFNGVKAGEIGGYIEKEGNLSHVGDCWVYANAKVFENAKIFENAKVLGNAMVYGNSQIFENAKVFGIAKVYGNTTVYGSAEVFGDATVYEDAKIHGYAHVSSKAKIYKNANIEKDTDYLVLGPIGSRNDFTTFYKTKDIGIWVACGCYNDSIEEFRRRVQEVHKDTGYSRNYLDACNFATAMLGSNCQS